MIPARIREYLSRGGIPFRQREHPSVVDASHLAAALHESGRRVCKVVIVEVAGRLWLAVLPANARVDLAKLGATLGAPAARMLNESEFAPLFPDCAVGAEPPFGRLFGLPVAMDIELTGEDRLVFRGGSHDDCLELAYEDFIDLEHPRLVAMTSRPDAPTQASTAN